MKILGQNRFIKYQLNDLIFLENNLFTYSDRSGISYKTNIYSDWFGYYFNYNSALKNYIIPGNDFLDFNLVDL
jgi:hypothetical protein